MKEDLSYILNHLGEDREKYFNAVSPPVIQTSNFCFRDLQQFRQAFTDELEHHIYTRGNNPTVAILRKKLAALEGAEDALVLSSGSGAIAAAVISQVKAGDHIVCVQSPYSWTQALLTKLLARFGVTHTFVDGKSMEAITQALQPNTRMLYLESPSSLTFELQDLQACAQLAKERGLVTIIDNSYSSPLFQNPIRHGIDIVVHSGTKYLNGHSDVVMGVICSSREIIKKIFESELMTLGAILQAHDAALAIRGLRTLELRLRRCDESARLIASRLAAHPKVERVTHPLLPGHPQYELARKQMSGTGGLFSAYFKVDEREKMEAFVQELKHFLLAVSWGGHESLILPSVGFYNIPGRQDTHVDWKLVRFYIGLEDPEWLWADLENGLKIL
ncbi:trans-sulfuration enzyme family protein [Flavilitoribacter nigricans]|uniref:Cystathionine beta-lyase n=1 Tax=Flavilitoribacter nigricans (strain ATCC 23147 / DSM 23189 / NBRC 102662 / NCIMB 1420 / SS-2) TaxID=1122177 RepID=A0A2D0NEX3_FLAN2|nr:PLP-dependent aspartate aminotransferase family protein [Flavilitoribacter nigricans]PHN06729.1 cystathionine beta-lyase [Flavilitoribacter nigricans DSM 23189 = NBRC 102662]